MQNFDYMTIQLASPKEIVKWCTNKTDNELSSSLAIMSFGQLYNFQTLDDKNKKPINGGLFCEQIFGPIKNWECRCGKYKKNKLFTEFRCELCGVLVTDSRIRRYKMGYILLKYPVVHIWYLNSVLKIFSTILNFTHKELKDIIYLRTLMPESELQFGVEILLKQLKNLDLVAEISVESQKLILSASQKSLQQINRKKCLKRIRILENFLLTESEPVWMILTVLPVLPPDLRPMVEIERGNMIESNLTELYTQIVIHNDIIRNEDNNIPQSIKMNNRRMLQEMVDNLIDIKKTQRRFTNDQKRPLLSLSDVLRGKQGIFRHNLLGKRVDYSGRSVIIVDPTLNLNNFGIPLKMALELFNPFIIREIVIKKFAKNALDAKKFIIQNPKWVTKVIKMLLMNHPIFLNRAPTLHRLGIQAFEPILTAGKAIKLHPLVCASFNADFDGDQMAVHVPLSLEAQAETYMLMLSPYNFLSPATGDPVLLPSQDIILGCNYLTANNIKDLRGSYHYFMNFSDALFAYADNQIELHSMIWVRYSTPIMRNFPQKKDNSFGLHSKKELLTKYILTTVGRIIFNNSVQDLAAVQK